MELLLCLDGMYGGEACVPWEVVAFGKLAWPFPVGGDKAGEVDDSHGADRVVTQAVDGLDHWTLRRWNWKTK
jgi:hypothetical protein